MLNFEWVENNKGLTTQCLNEFNFLIYQRQQPCMTAVADMFYY